VNPQKPLTLDQYQLRSARTDKSESRATSGLNFLMLGLFGEVGSLLSELKKKQRDKSAYFAYELTSIEELGDVLWYLASVSRKLGFPLSAVAAGVPETAAGGQYQSDSPVRTFRELQPQYRLFGGPVAGLKVEKQLLQLGAKIGTLLTLVDSEAMDQAAIQTAITSVFTTLVNAADDAEINLESAALRNLEKIEGKWPTEPHWGESYDANYDDDERFPPVITIRFKEKCIDGKFFVIQQCKGINLGDRLTDNRKEPDDYRFHDIFHISFAAILGWSPVLRALLKLKRKSSDLIDEQQDGARAIIVEEGISNWVFSQGIRHSLFRDGDSLDFALLKAIRDMVEGYEVESRPLWMWERAILEAFRVFRLLKENRGGVVTADLLNHKLEFAARDE
jgi:NTP pyrophosphatase (non-canonical NTP hydrolase)